MSKPKVRGMKNKSHVHGFWPLTDFLLDLSSTVKDYMVTKFQGQRSKAKVTETKNASYLFLEKNYFSLSWARVLINDHEKWRRR